MDLTKPPKRANAPGGDPLSGAAGEDEEAQGGIANMRVVNASKVTSNVCMLAALLLAVFSAIWCLSSTSDGATWLRYIQYLDMPVPLVSKRLRWPWWSRWPWSRDLETPIREQKNVETFRQEIYCTPLRFRVNSTCRGKYGEGVLRNALTVAQCAVQ